MICKETMVDDRRGKFRNISWSFGIGGGGIRGKTSSWLAWKDQFHLTIVKQTDSKSQILTDNNLTNPEFHFFLIYNHKQYLQV